MIRALEYVYVWRLDDDLPIHSSNKAVIFWGKNELNHYEVKDFYFINNNNNIDIISFTDNSFESNHDDSINYGYICNNLLLSESQKNINCFESSPFKDENDKEFDKKFHFIIVRQPSPALIIQFLQEKLFKLMKKMNYDNLIFDIICTSKRLHLINAFNKLNIK